MANTSQYVVVTAANSQSSIKSRVQQLLSLRCKRAPIPEIPIVEPDDSIVEDIDVPPAPLLISLHSVYLPLLPLQQN